MTTRQSVAAINASLDAITALIGPNAALDIYTGLPPSSLLAGASGIKLVAATLPPAWLGASANATKTQIGAWTGTGIAKGFAGYARISDAARAAAHLQFAIGEPWKASSPYALGQQVNAGGNCYACATPGVSASLGGPSGTGAVIIDGTCIWTYVEPADVTMDNTSISTGQIVNLSTIVLSGVSNE
jgi:hypothetical protein